MEILKTYNINNDIEQNHKFWENYGFLEGIRKPFDYELAYLFHCATCYLISGIKIHTFNEKIILCEKIVKPLLIKKDSYSYVQIETLYYPCIRRVYTKSYEDIDGAKGLNVYDLFEVLKRFFNNITEESFNKLEREISPYIPMDMQAEYCAWFCNYYSDIYNSHKKHLILENEKPSSGFIKKQIKNNVDKWRDEQRRNIRNKNV